MAGPAPWQIDEPLINIPGLPPGSQLNSHAGSKQCSQLASKVCSTPGTPSLPPIVPGSSLGGSGQQTPELPFRTFEPKTREQRRAAGDKFALEKIRIAQRNPKAEPPQIIDAAASKVGSLKTQSSTKLPDIDDPIMPTSQTSLYMDSYSRFTYRDAAAAEHERKQAALQKKEAMYARKRHEHFMREARSWENNKAACDRGDTIAATKREAGQGGTRRNRGGTSYDIVTLDYAKTAGGEALKYQDSVTRYKAHLRSNNLYSKNHSTGFNILTGEPAWKPPPIKAPWEQQSEKDGSGACKAIALSDQQ